MSNNLGAKGDIKQPKSTAVFFCFVAASLLSLQWFRLKGFDALPEQDKLMGCMLLLVLISGAYGGAAPACSMVLATLTGAVTAAAVCVAVKSQSIYVLAFILIAVPLQFILSVRRIKLAAFLSLAASAVITVSVLFR